MKSKEDFLASLEIIKESIKHYDEGQVNFYRVVATELRKLLCDKDPLILKIYPNIYFHKFHSTKLLEDNPNLKDDLRILLPGQIGGLHFIPKFVGQNDLLNLSDWLSQPILIYGEINIFNLIKSVADKEGAHSDKEFNETILLSKLIKFNDTDSYKSIIVGIGEYIINLIKQEYYNK